ncbi:ankyrin repeat domain-containing protein [Alloscardovia theropitheci]|uniref:Ankyrin repeat domain-containing protein n=1 Tax=Alloscardovia theropitheci TaxID=2496842 RepID=A0A4V6N6W9_9BIFI|nr:ankyrin repeat domain-containing protein [Alloscardovia theropitheci]TCD54659.1 ankyrin repeat domain-containing protein [Alloscardovia theropitheci]
MAKKRITLPKNFDELIESGDVEALKAVYDKCELTVHSGRYSLRTALHYSNVPDELVTWLVEQGLDVNIPDYYGCSPLYTQATFGKDTVKLLYELGADIQFANKSGNTPLHAAAEYFRVETVRFLIEKGANVHAQNQRGQTPLSLALISCRGQHIIPTVKIANMLISAGATVTPAMSERVSTIGKEFEFYKDGFNKANLPQTEEALTELYDIFGVQPVAHRVIHDGVSPIVIQKDSWQHQYNDLWDLLVPSQGVAQTVQGEVIRIAGRIHDEITRNGGANWDRNYRDMLNSLPHHFATGTPLSKEQLEETKNVASHILAHGEVDFTAADRLCELAVSWVVLNPNPYPLESVNYRR